MSQAVITVSREMISPATDHTPPASEVIAWAHFDLPFDESINVVDAIQDRERDWIILLQGDGLPEDGIWVLPHVVTIFGQTSVQALQILQR